jgi:hypothetical protein
VPLLWWIFLSVRSDIEERWRGGAQIKNAIYRYKSANVHRPLKQQSTGIDMPHVILISSHATCLSTYLLPVNCGEDRHLRFKLSGHLRFQIWHTCVKTDGPLCFLSVHLILRVIRLKGNLLTGNICRSWG